VSGNLLKPFPFTAKDKPASRWTFQ
jgi:hypothetical protein